jgi:hypothetical protein
LFPFEQDLAIEEISPFNNRCLLYNLFRVQPERRRAPTYPFFRKLIRHLWAEALTEKINPGSHYVTEVVKSNSLMRYLVLASLQRVKALRSGLRLRRIKGGCEESPLLTTEVIAPYRR